MIVAAAEPEGSIFRIVITRMDFPDKSTMLKEILILLKTQYEGDGFLMKFPLIARPLGTVTTLRSSRSPPKNIFLEFGTHFHSDNLYLQFLLLQFFGAPAPSAAVRYQLHSDLHQAYGRRRLFSDDEMAAFMTAKYAEKLRLFLSNPIVGEGVILYDIMQNIKMYDLFHLFDRIQRVSTKIAEENAKEEELTDRRLRRLLELNHQFEELSIEEVVAAILPIKEEYEKDLGTVHQIISSCDRSTEEWLEEFPLLAATAGKDFEFSSLLAVPPFNEDLKAAIMKAGRRKSNYRTTRKNKGAK